MPRSRTTRCAVSNVVTLRCPMPLEGCGEDSDEDENAVNAWFALLLAGLLEVAWALGLKYSDGLTRLWPSLGMLTAIALSFALLAVALKSIPFGTAYALWTGIGAAGTVIVGMAAFGEPTDVFRVTCLSLIIAGLVGLKLASGH